jgi:hypothetical protein
VSRRHATGAWPIAARAQEAGKIPRIGWIILGSHAGSVADVFSYYESFRAGLRRGFAQWAGTRFFRIATSESDMRRVLQQSAYIENPSLRKTLVQLSYYDPAFFQFTENPARSWAPPSSPASPLDSVCFAREIKGALTPSRTYAFRLKAKSNTAS